MTYKLRIKKIINMKMNKISYLKYIKQRKYKVSIYLHILLHNLITQQFIQRDYLSVICGQNKTEMNKLKLN